MRWFIFVAGDPGGFSPVGAQSRDGRFGAMGFDSREGAEAFAADLEAKGKIEWSFVSGRDEEAMQDLVARLQSHKEGSGVVLVDGDNVTGWFAAEGHLAPEDFRLGSSTKPGEGKA